MSKLFLAIATLSTLAISTTVTVAEGISVAQAPNCNNPQTQSEINQCAAIAYRNSDRRLNQVYQQLVPRLSSSRKQKLIQAQRAWITFRDASCEFERSEFQGGTIAPAIYNGCLADLTERRTQELEEYLQNTQR
ncbi:lysozyme inhibitor LprI family protein [Oscillatoria salina]|uniref:lysozyme inhibitor LprI family protein n=1 Tax=Oscillatoria salina TaxID=331517 RepID=UPI0013BE0E67|nr:lysozyme inhibitor LprI family protein [Oscillatoria salina]MBZ8178896.1 lysozyme inhibitor LprI family protein [Oscillatoria salina IIICB1]NET86678.1 lysozyme inhibitor LprI family protein [Kamptonema sp. SIO1D9]